MLSKETDGFSLPLQRGPFQNNGATPWFCELNMGTPGQTLKFCFDTGSNFNWVTSSLCSDDGCQHYANGRFMFSESSTFEWIDQTGTTVDFGPWGCMEAEEGRDKLCMPTQKALDSCLLISLYLSKKYSGTQFDELDWDGGIGLPSGEVSEIPLDKLSGAFRLAQSHSGQPIHSHFLLDLMEKGFVSKKRPFISFLNDMSEEKSARGTVSFGLLDDAYSTSLEYLFLPWARYREEVPYLWSAENASISVGDNLIGEDLYFTLDSGSSQFKGDKTVLKKVFEQTTESSPVVSISLTDSGGEEYGLLEITSDVYRCDIEEGQHKGQAVSQFQSLTQAEGMLLVGSVLMDHLYTVYEYEEPSDGQLAPKGVWIFNKPDGPKIIQTKQKEPASLFNTLKAK
ncbi:pepsin-like aspartic protease [Enterovibrio norvegicus]|uniref:Pepsin-like aspartic protease n=1 Tax=Enterovibrio norvegicus TaxID=188144 RepID=A0ABV4L677_9GAMM|nr:pepsin-like aspartic protease [Enterovibrio norvegicus]TKF30831.1 A1 family peptidase [Enterovibrio norvegicus]